MLEFDNTKELVNEVIDYLKNNTITKLPLLGEGNFTLAYNYQNRAVIKINKNIPKNLSNITDLKHNSKFINICINEMKSEIAVYDSIKPTPSVFPKFMIPLLTDKNYYIIREYGRIFTDPKDITTDIAFRDWIPYVVIQSNFNQFIKELYNICLNIGFFNDSFQIAFRKDISIFLYDLGQFIRINDVTDDMNNIISQTNSKDDINKNIRYGLDLYRSRMQGLAKRLHLKAIIPRNVLDFYKEKYKLELEIFRLILRKNPSKNGENMLQQFIDELEDIEKLCLNNELSPSVFYNNYSKFLDLHFEIR